MDGPLNDDMAMSMGLYSILRNYQVPSAALSPENEDGMAITYMEHGEPHKAVLTASRLIELAEGKTDGSISRVVLDGPVNEGKYHAWKKLHWRGLEGKEPSYMVDTEIPLLVAASMLLDKREDLAKVIGSFPGLKDTVEKLQERYRSETVMQAYVR